MRSDRRIILGVLGSIAMSAWTGWPAAAKRRGRDDDDDDRDDQKAAARARAAGEILPLTDILDHLKVAYPGDVVEIELDREKGRWVYEVKLIEPTGRLVEIYVDARDKKILKIEGK